MASWKAIEQYLTEVEREVTRFDQQVPQMMSADSDIMLSDQDSTDSQTVTDGFLYDVAFTGGPAPVCVTETNETTAMSRAEVSELHDLDQPSHDDVSLYQNDDVYNNYKIKSELESVEIHNETTRDIKQEPYTDSDYSPQCNNYYGANEHAQYDETYWNMTSTILNECSTEVTNTCKCLGISLDPMCWSRDDVQQWITWQCGQYNLPRPNMDNFYITGHELCCLSDDHFKYMAGEAGSTLYSRLEIWLSVVEQKPGRACYPQISQIPVPTSPSLPSSPGTVSPTPSTWSEPEITPQPTHRRPPPGDDRLPEEPVHHHRQTIQLWQFLKLLLLDPSGNYNDCIRWVDRSHGIFKIENSARVAKLWGKRKNRPAMNYDKLSRSIRQYYKKNIIKKTQQSKRLVYQFCHH